MTLTSASHGWEMLGGSVEFVDVPAHVSPRLTTKDGWTFWRVRTGCIRVQRGDFTAYLSREAAAALSQFIWDTDEESD